MENVINHISSKHPHNSKKIAEILQQLENELDESVQLIKGDVHNALQHDRYDDVQKYTELLRIMEQVNVKVEGYRIAFSSAVIPQQNSSAHVDPVHEIVELDRSRAHKLTEVFTNKKPKAFEICGKEYNCNDWKDVLMHTCEFLYAKSPILFRSFLTDEEMQGRKRTIFGTVADHMMEARKLKGTDIYIMTNLSADSIIRIIRKMLKKYGISESKYHIYLRIEYVRNDV